MLTKNLIFSLRNDLIVTGHDGEMADYDNPRGEVYGEAYYVIATVEGTSLDDPQDGFQYRHFKTFMNRNGKEAAMHLLWKMEQEVKEGRKVFNDDFWQEIEPCYGTQAWLNWNADHPETWND